MNIKCTYLFIIVCALRVLFIKSFRLFWRVLVYSFTSSSLTFSVSGGRLVWAMLMASFSWALHWVWPWEAPTSPQMAWLKWSQGICLPSSLLARLLQVSYIPWLRVQFPAGGPFYTACYISEFHQLFPLLLQLLLVDPEDCILPSGFPASFSHCYYGPITK